MADLKTQFESAVDNISAGFEIASMGPKITQLPNQYEPLNLCLRNINCDKIGIINRFDTV